MSFCGCLISSLFCKGRFPRTPVSENVGFGEWGFQKSSVLRNVDSAVKNCCENGGFGEVESRRCVEASVLSPKIKNQLDRKKKKPI